jgi:hypothetical protein
MSLSITIHSHGRFCGTRFVVSTSSAFKSALPVCWESQCFGFLHWQSHVHTCTIAFLSTLWNYLIQSIHLWSSINFAHNYNNRNSPIINYSLLLAHYLSTTDWKSKQQFTEINRKQSIMCVQESMYGWWYIAVVDNAFFTLLLSVSKCALEVAFYLTANLSNLRAHSITIRVEARTLTSPFVTWKCFF